MDELKTAYIKKLGKMLSVETTIIEHLPTMIEMAGNEDLREGLSEHLEETREQRERLVQILKAHHSTSAKEKDEAFALMMQEAGKEIAQIRDEDVRDAVIIASAQAVEHIEMAKYGTLVAWAKQLGDSDGEALLKDTLAEEKAADKKLSAVAEGGMFATGINEKAAKV